MTIFQKLREFFRGRRPAPPVETKSEEVSLPPGKHPLAGAVTHHKHTSYITRPPIQHEPKSEEDTEEGISLADLARAAEQIEETEQIEEIPAAPEPTTPAFEGFLGGESGGGGASGTWTAPDTDETVAQPSEEEKPVEEEKPSEEEKPDAET